MEDKYIGILIMVLILAIGTVISIAILKEERIEKVYIEKGYQEVLVGSNRLWQKVPQPEAR